MNKMDINAIQIDSNGLQHDLQFLLYKGHCQANEKPQMGENEGPLTEAKKAIDNPIA